MKIPGQFGIENYSWKVGIMQKICKYCWFFVCNFLCQTVSILSDQMCQYPQTKMCQFFLLAICIMGILGQSGTKNYVWRLGIIQNLCEFCWFFLYDFWAQNVPIPQTYKLLTRIFAKVILKLEQFSKM